MNQRWEDKFSNWARPPSDSETQRCENARVAIRKAIDGSAQLSQRNVKVFSQGSYRNNTNIRQESDVDIGVLCYDTFFPEYPSGTDHSTFGNTNATYHYATFKNEVEQALVAHFGRAIVRRGNKAFDIEENSHHAEIDVAAFFEHRRYATNGTYISGVELRPDNGQPNKVTNWPEQHHENGVAKNNATSRRYKSAVRILKNLRNEMTENGIAVPDSIIGFLIECLVWNVPNRDFGHDSYYEDIRSVLVSLYNSTKSDEGCGEWGEVSDLKYLFRPSQKWTRTQANAFILDAWKYVGFE